MCLSPGWEVKLLYCEFQAQVTRPFCVVSSGGMWPIAWACPRHHKLIFADKGAADQMVFGILIRNLAKCSKITYSRMIWAAWDAVGTR